MLRKTLIAAASLTALGMAAPASATWWSTHSHTCWCGHQSCTSTSSTTGGSTTTTSGGSGGSTTTSGGSGGSTTTSGGTAVPEPGMLGLAGAGLLGLGAIRLRRRRVQK